MGDQKNVYLLVSVSVVLIISTRSDLKKNKGRGSVNMSA